MSFIMNNFGFFFIFQILFIHLQLRIHGNKASKQMQREICDNLTFTKNGKHKEISMVTQRKISKHKFT